MSGPVSLNEPQRVAIRVIYIELPWATIRTAENAGSQIIRGEGKHAAILLEGSAPRYELGERDYGHIMRLSGDTIRRRFEEGA